MLTCTAKRVLNAINSACKDYKRAHPYDVVAKAHELDIMVKLPKLAVADLRMIIQDLINKGYISKYRDELDSYKQEYKGQRYKEFSRIELKAFVFKSVLVPILVAAITAIVVILVSNLF